MSYAGDRIIHDADSHLMEMPDFLTAPADASVRSSLPNLGQTTTGIFDPGEHVGLKRPSPETVARLLELGDQITRGPKWHDALGAFNGEERGKALDLLGFQRQVIFSSFCGRL
ncbi:MAG: hydrolase, partial [Pseudomonadota bacterium]|nr:hydrolase [Pseudomonadota bacterium]